jgi:hypothetical protein
MVIPSAIRDRDGSNPCKRPARKVWRGWTLAVAIVLVLQASMQSSVAQDAGVIVPEVAVISVTPEGGSSDSLVEEWDEPRRPPTLSGKERQAILIQVSGGGAGGLPLLNNIQTQGKTPTLRQVILTSKRPWYVHRAFLAGEGVQRMDARSAMSFDESIPGRAIVGLNLIAGHTYLVDFLLRGAGEGVYRVETSAGPMDFPDPGAQRTHVLLALEAENNGWTEISLSRDAGSFDLHSVEVTLARGPTEED